MDVSVITVNINGKHHLEKFLPSIYGTRGDFELIISDNGSTDGSCEYIKHNYPQTKIIENGKNLGFALGNNIAAKISKADFLVFINPDTSVEPDWLENLLKPFSDQNVGLTTSKILLMKDKEKINTCGNSIHISGITQCRGINEPSTCYKFQDEVTAVSGAAFAIRRDLFERLSGFDADFFLYMEETDLSMRARISGRLCIYVPNSIIYHDYHLRFGPNKVFYQERNRYQMLLKNLKFGTLLIMFPILLLSEIITWGFVILQDRKSIKDKILAYSWVIINWNPIMKKRKSVQQGRTTSDKVLLLKTEYKINFLQVSTGIVSYFSFMFNLVFLLMKTCLLFLLSIFDL
ncbi:MAG: glycosyltransferase family 2 protein [Flexilinea sp.]